MCTLNSKSHTIIRHYRMAVLTKSDAGKTPPSIGRPLPSQSFALKGCVNSLVEGERFALNGREDLLSGAARSASSCESKSFANRRTSTLLNRSPFFLLFALSGFQWACALSPMYCSTRSCIATIGSSRRMRFSRSFCALAVSLCCPRRGTRPPERLAWAMLRRDMLLDGPG